MSNTKTFHWKKVKFIHWRAYRKVVLAYHEYKESMGSTPIMDYSRNTGGQGAQYSFNDAFFRPIEFVADVEKTFKSVLTPEELLLVKKDLKTLPDFKVNSLQYLAIQAKLGQAFFEREMYPIKRYFTVEKKPRYS